MPKPNCFIVGAPKCGTTALAHYLSEHSEVFFSAPKEPHYFVYEDMPLYAGDNSELANYLALFSDATEAHKVIAEGSVWYLMTQTAIQKIYQFDPQAKIIVMLRRPDEMVYSMHSTNLKVAAEHQPIFTKAWKDGLISGKRQPKTSLCRDGKILQYHEIARYQRQLERLFSIFPAEQIHIILYDDLKRDTVSVFAAVQNFLGLSPEEGKIEFSIINENAENRSAALAKITHGPPQFIVERLPKIKKALGIESLHILDFFKRLNERKQTRQPIEPCVKQAIIENYAADISYVEKLLQRDLSDWRQ